MLKSNQLAINDGKGRSVVLFLQHAEMSFSLQIISHLNTIKLLQFSKPSVRKFVKCQLKFVLTSLKNSSVCCAKLNFRLRQPKKSSGVVKILQLYARVKFWM